MSKSRPQIEKPQSNTNSLIIPAELVQADGFNKGVSMTLAYTDILDRQNKLSFMLTRVADAIALTEGATNRGDKLRAWFANLDAVNEIRDAIWALKDAYADFTKYYSASVIPSVIHDGQKQLFVIADDFREGLRILLNVDGVWDNGEVLKTVVLEHTPKLEKICAELKNTSPKVGPKQSLNWLRESWKQYEDEHPSTPPEKVRLAMLEKVAIRIGKGDAPDSFQMREGLSEDKQHAFESLNTRAASKHPAKYKYDLMHRKSKTSE